MSISFQEQWRKYIHLYWTPIFDKINTKDLFEKESILAWGWVPFEEYKSSKIYQTSPLDILNNDLRVYYYVRTLNDLTTKFLCFVNTIEFKQRLMNEENLDSDYLFLKRLYENNLSIYHIFHHEYHRNCWDGINIDYKL
jgi:hypothetical protein